MEETILKSEARCGSAKKVRAAGFTPGVLHGPGSASESVQFDTVSLNKILAKHGPNAKVFITAGDSKKFGFIKEVQKNPLDHKIIHVAVQLVDQDKKVTMELPILFHGREKLEVKHLETHMLKTEMKVEGKSADIPEVAAADVSAKKLGDSITAADFHFPDGVVILEHADEVFAVVKAMKVVAEEEPAEEEPAK